VHNCKINGGGVGARRGGADRVGRGVGSCGGRPVGLFGALDTGQGSARTVVGSYNGERRGPLRPIARPGRRPASQVRCCGSGLGRGSAGCGGSACSSVWAGSRGQ